jgi:two-component system alkaline phosphatase synthesis response regulator PhoP
MQARNGRYRILIVEDEALIADSLCYLLEEAGYNVTSVADGREGLERALEAPPHLIISDYMMPRMNGLEMIKRLRAAGNTTPIILLTAVPEVNIPPEAGYDAYLRKPYIEQRLLDAVRKIMLSVGLK